MNMQLQTVALDVYMRGDSLTCWRLCFCSVRCQNLYYCAYAMSPMCKFTDTALVLQHDRQEALRHVPDANTYSSKLLPHCRPSLQGLCNDIAVIHSLSQRSVPQLHAQSWKLP